MRNLFAPGHRAIGARPRKGRRAGAPGHRSGATAGPKSGANGATVVSQHSAALRRVVDILRAGMAACELLVLLLLLPGCFAGILLIAGAVHLLEAVVRVCELVARWPDRLRPVRASSP